MKENKTTEFGDALNKALSAEKPVDINDLVWKDKSGKDIRLMDMDEITLQKAYNHTTDMLYNKVKYLPGKCVMKSNIKKLIEECNSELFLRYIIHECNIDTLKTNFQLIEFIRAYKAEYNCTDEDKVTHIFTSVPPEFQSLTIGQLLTACFDKLDVINRKMISDQFIVSQGLWLTNQEKIDLREYDDNGKVRNWLDVVHERLMLNNVRLRVDPKGFSYNEFRNLVQLESITKIAKIPTATLRLLRDKVFIRLDADTDYHINKWLTIKSNIEKVAEYKGFHLNMKNYDN